MNYFADNAILLAVKKLPGGAYGAYTTLKTAFPATPFFAVCYQSLSPESKEKIKDFVKKDTILGKFYRKYLILTLLFDSEKMSIKDVLTKYGDIAKPYLEKLEIDLSPQTLKSQLDMKVDKIIVLMKTYQDPSVLFKYVPSIPFGGKSTRKKRRTRKRGGNNEKIDSLKKSLDSMSKSFVSNTLNYTKTPKSPDYYYPTVFSNLKPELWTDRVKRKCTNPSEFSNCVIQNCSPIKTHDSCDLTKY